MFLSAQSQDLSSLCSYWQSSHRLKTSAGYIGFPNLDFDGPIVGNSPFAASAMLEPSYLTTPSSMDLGASSGVDFRDLRLALPHAAPVRLSHLSPFPPRLPHPRRRRGDGPRSCSPGRRCSRTGRPPSSRAPGSPPRRAGSGSAPRDGWIATGPAGDLAHAARRTAARGGLSDPTRRAAGLHPPGRGLAHAPFGSGPVRRPGTRPLDRRPRTGTDVRDPLVPTPRRAARTHHRERPRGAARTITATPSR